MRGTLKWFNNTKGYGFIGRDDGSDVFVHYSVIVGEGYRTLQEEDLVEFEIVQGRGRKLPKFKRLRPELHPGLVHLWRRARRRESTGNG